MRYGTILPAVLLRVFTGTRTGLGRLVFDTKAPPHDRVQRTVRLPPSRRGPPVLLARPSVDHFELQPVWRRILFR
jgi:hypothetical protein